MSGLHKALETTRGHIPSLSLYKELQKSVYTKTIHPLKASEIIATAISNGHPPPEIYPSSRENLRHLIKRYIKRDLNVHAKDEIYRCLTRGHIDDYTLLQPIADDYINCLISSLPTVPKSRQRALELRKVVAFMQRLEKHGDATSVKPTTYTRLIRILDECTSSCKPTEIISIALKHDIPLDVNAWNLQLQDIAKTAPSNIYAAFLEMMNGNVTPNVYTFAILLKCLRLQPDMELRFQQVLAVAKNLKICNEHIVVEEMSLLKKQRRYQELLTVFARAYGPEVLNHLGFASLKVASQQRASKLKVSKVSMSLVIDALVRINATPESLNELYIAYQAYIEGKPEFERDIYTPSIFIRAFANFKPTLVKAVGLFEKQLLNKKRYNRPNVVSYAAIIDGLTRQGMMDAAAKVHQHMEADHIKSNPHIWKILLRGYKIAGDDRAVRACERLLAQSHPVQHDAQSVIEHIDESVLPQ